MAEETQQSTKEGQSRFAVPDGAVLSLLGSRDENLRLAEELLKGGFAGKDTITVQVGEVTGEKKLTFDATNGGTAPELVGAAAATGEGKI